MDIVDIIIQAELGNLEAQYVLGNCYMVGKGVEQDYTKAFEWLNKASLQGNHNGQYLMGICYTFGYGVEKNYNLAVEWLQKAAEQGDESAIELLKQFKIKKKSIIDRFLDLFR